MTENEILSKVRGLQLSFHEGDIEAGRKLGKIIIEHYDDQSALGDHLREIAPDWSSDEKERNYVFIQTPTYFWVGALIIHGTHGQVMTDCAWVRDTGEDPGAMFRTGEWASGYGVPGVHILSRLAVMNIIGWDHPNKPWKQAE